MQSVGLLLQAGVTHYALIYDREKGHVCLQFVIRMMPLRRCVQGMVEVCIHTNSCWSKTSTGVYGTIIYNMCVLNNQGWSQPHFSSTTSGGNQLQ